jgi:pSer/pThr/pTyr-binding forkhead associated (FHA) protein
MSQVMAILRFNSGPRTGEAISLDKNKVTFGRSSSSDCVLAHATVSREHFYVERNNGKLFLVDQGSENGTFVNSERVSWIELKQGDVVGAGPFSFVFELEQSNGPRNEVGSADPPQAGRWQLDASTGRIYPLQYMEGIEHFNAGRYFDAHEVWEEIWLRSSGDTKTFYQLLIQAAVGLHHYERGNARGAKAMHANVTDKLSRLPARFMSLDLVAFSRQFNRYLAELIEPGEAPPVNKSRPRIELIDAGEWSL